MHRGLVIQPTYRIRGGVPIVQLYGRLESGEAFQVEDDRFRPYFFVPSVAADAVRSQRDVELEDTLLRDLHGTPVTRVTVPVPAAVVPLRERLSAQGIPCLEADIRFPYRFLIDQGIRAGIEIEGEAEAAGAGLLYFHNPALRAATARPALSTLSIDLETTPDASKILSVALVGAGADDVELVSERPVDGAHCHPDEKALLEATLARIRALDPDVLLGWNVVDFDLRVLDRRCQALGVHTPLGRVPGAIGFQQDPGYTRQTRGDVPGRVVLDGIPMLRDAVRLPDYRLETVAQAVLGRGKKIDQEAPDAAAEIQRLYREEPEALVAYNREDAQLVLDILDHEGLLDLAVERSLLCGMPLDRVGASVASFDRTYLGPLRERGYVAPSVDRERPNELVKGGALLEPVPGLFERVAVFDFKSLYPSLMRTFALDPLAHALAGDDAVVAPNGARFAREDALLPAVLEEFMVRREHAKARGDRHADQAIKIMMNSLFGVLGTPSCRFFDPAIANAITSFGQQTLHWSAEAFRAEGVEVIYGDTDSVFVKLGGDDRDEAEALRARIEERVGDRIRREYGVEPRLTLELEKVFDRLFLPRVRGGRAGSKKRYAGWLDGHLVVVGLESVRRDWPAVTRRLQEGMLERLFRDEPVMPFVGELAEQLQAGALDDELVYVKRVRKGSLDKYTKATPPHIQAARKAAELLRAELGDGATGRYDGRVVRYLITERGPEPVIPGRARPTGIDRRHYLEKVVRPVADAILLELGQSVDEALGEPQQLGLF